MLDSLAKRPIASLAIFAVIGLTLVIVQMQRVIQDTRYSTALEAAVSYSAAMTSIREFYSSEVVPRARNAGVLITHQYRDLEDAIPFPATLTIDLGERVSRNQDGGRFRLYSDYPFPWRTNGGPRDDFERQALTVLDGTDAPSRFVRLETTDGRDFLRYATPVRMKESCVGCHNSHALSPRRDWKVGDLRGVQSVVVPLPKLGILGNSDIITEFVFMIGGVALGVVLFGFFLRRLRNALDREHGLLELAERRNVALVEAKTVAEAANRTKTEFLANMSHELRTPLNAVIGFSEIMRDQALGPLGQEKYVEYAGDINASGSRLLGVINDILDISRIEVGKHKLHEAEFDVGHALDTCLGLIRERAETARITLMPDFEPDLPRLYADPRDFKQIVVNLLSNAVKFTHPGGRVRLAAREDQGGLVVVVADTGIGIAADDIPKALAPFRQVDSRLARKYEGTGLGLPLCKALIELHGGGIALDSAAGAGTTVTIRFPAHRLRREEASAA